MKRKARLAVHVIKQPEALHALEDNLSSAQGHGNTLTVQCSQLAMTLRPTCTSSR